MDSTSALVMMDYQVGVCQPPASSGDEVKRRDILARAAACLRRVRASNGQVIHVGVAFGDLYLNRLNRSGAFAALEAKGRFRAGSEEVQFCPEVMPLDNEPVLFKGCVDPFVGTGLLQTLIRHGVTDVYLGGVATNFVVESAARHASDSGFRVTVLEDICASYSQEMHQFACERTLPLFARLAASSDTMLASAD